MVKILAGLLAAIVIAVGGFFGFEFYAQKRISGEVEAAFASVRATGAKATYGKVGFDLWSRTVTVSDIVGESSAQPPVAVKIGQFVAGGVSEPETGRFAADRIDASDVEVAGSMMAQAGLIATYKAPRLQVTNYAGPAGPLRRLESTAPVDVYRFVLEHFAAINASAVTVPSVTATIAAPAANRPVPGTGDYTYTGLALRDIKNGKIASTTIEQIKFTVGIDAAGKRDAMTGQIDNMAALDFDAGATAAILDPARASDSKTYRLYRQTTAGPYMANFDTGLKMRIDRLSADEIGIVPAKLQFATLMAIVDAAPPPGTTATPQQMRDMIEKMAGVYEGMSIGGAELRGLTMETPQGPFAMAALRLGKLEGGKLSEFAVEGLDARAPQGPVKVGRFALKSLDVANLMRVAAQFSAQGRNPPPDQLAALLLLLEGTEISGVVAPYKNTNDPVNIDTLNLSWGQFVGPIPTRARLSLKMSGPVDLSDPDPFKMMAVAGMKSAAMSFDLGAAWNEGARAFALEPAALEIGGVLTAALRMSLTNVPREMFSVNPLQAAIMAAQVEAGPIELALRDVGGVDLVVAQFARAQRLSPDAARTALVQNVREAGMKMSGANADAMAIAGAMARALESPRGTLTIKLTPRGKVPMMQLIDALKGNPLAALARFQVEATAGR